MGSNETMKPEAATTLALSALVWTLQDHERASRFLAVTGLDPDDLRSRADDPAVLAALIGYLCAHQPDLIACADVLAVSPEKLARAKEVLDA